MNTENWKVIKRNNELVDFKQINIEEAILGAARDLEVKFEEGEFNSIIGDILVEIYANLSDNMIGVEDIQDIVENVLIDHNYMDVAKQFIRYRYDRKKIREFVESKEAFIEKYKHSSNNANATVDDNSNVASKNIATANNEIHKEDNIQTSRGMIMRKLKELYPNDNPKQYLKDLESHIIYKHDESSFAGAIAPYCCSISLYPFLNSGIKELGGLSAAPKNLDSFCGIYINLIFAVSSQFAGAVATSEFLLYFDYFARKEWGEDYYKHLDNPVKFSIHGNRTIGDQIHQHFQQVVYSINQPTAARGMQSAFVNFSYFDKPFFDNMFENFYFPDGTAPKWESLCWLQKDFMQWFNQERLKTILTFPVESFALIYKDGKFEDQESADFVAEEYARGHSFFTYISDSVDSLSSCCFEGDEIIKVYDKKGEESTLTVKEFVEKFIPEDQNNSYEQHLDTQFTTRSYDQNGNTEDNIPITGILKKRYVGDLYYFNIDGCEISVTPDHILLVKNIKTGTVESIPAKIVFRNIDDYLFAIDEDEV